MKNKLTQYIFLFLILLTAAWLRINTFWLPHTSGDEFHYLGLALKLDSCGLDGYNISRIDHETFSLDGKTNITEIVLAPEGEKGKLLEEMYKRGRAYYDNPLYNNSPGLPYLLMCSQKTIGGGKGYFVSSTRIGKYVTDFKPKSLFDAQFYAVVWPFIFSLVFVFLMWVFGRQLFGPAVGLIAAFLLASNPVSIFASQKIWGDELSAVFVLLAAIFFFRGYKKRSALFGVLSGVVVGIAVLFKQTAGFYVVGLMVFYLFDNINLLKSPKGLRKFFFNPFALTMLVAFIAVAGFWFFKVYDTYGEFIHKHIAGPGIKDLFYKMKNSRPSAAFIFLIGIPYLSPLLLLAWGAAYKNLRHKAGSSKQYYFTFLVLWIAAYFFFLVFLYYGKEHRYILGAYPAIIVLSAYVVNLFRLWLKKYTMHWKWFGATEIIIVLLLLNARWSIYLVMDLVYEAASMILKPF